jgi:hypothetical protein
MGEVTREELAAMTDQALQFWHAGMAGKKADKRGSGGGAASTFGETARIRRRIPAIAPGRRSG